MLFLNHQSLTLHLNGHIAPIVNPSFVYFTYVFSYVSYSVPIPTIVGTSCGEVLTQ